MLRLAPTPPGVLARPAKGGCYALVERRWPDVFPFVLADYQRRAAQRQPDLFTSALSAESTRFTRIRGLSDR